MIKNYLLDTNILLANPNAIFNFEDNNLYLCGTTLQELDKFKEEKGTERGYNAREACRILDSLREIGIETYVDKSLSVEEQKEQSSKIFDYKHGVPLSSGGKLFVEPDGVNIEYLPKGYGLDNPDNRIISSCIHMNKYYLKDNNVILLTNDVSMRINACICGLQVQGVINDQVENVGYTGHLELEIEDWKVIQDLYTNKELKNPDIAIKEIADLEYPLLENQFVTLTSGDQCALTVFRTTGDGKPYARLELIPELKKLSNGIQPLNKMQRYAMWALLNPEIPLVILEGQAGTSKTFVSLACGLEQLDVGDHADTEPYKRMMISRPNAGSSDPDFGYLPGTLEEKMNPLIASYMDNLEEILGDKDTPSVDTRFKIEDMMTTGLIELCPLYSIRGRSIHNSYLICDEAQNASKNLIRDVVTRAGRNTKIVVAGDPRQVDAHTLNSRNNGLVYLKDSMKGSPLCAIFKFDNANCVRSKLAEDAITRMK